MVLGNLDNSRARAYCVCSRWGGGCLDILFLTSLPSLREAALYRLQYFLKGPLTLNQPTSQANSQQEA